MLICKIIKRYNALQELAVQFILDKIQQIVEIQFQEVYNKSKYLSETTTMTFQEVLDKEIEKLKK